MKSTFTKVSALLVAGLLSSAANAQTINYIWGAGATTGVSDGEFNGGLNAWTTISGGTDPDALWVWKADGNANQGAYSGGGGGGPVASPSVGNGAAIFDSDFYDNGGSTSGAGTGIAPAPHTSYLTSPVIDCGAATDVSVQFYQFHRNFDSNTSIVVSYDGGATFADTIQVNNNFGDGPVATNSSVNDKRIYRLPNSAGTGFHNVVIRFVFAPGDNDGCYYNWVVDDVSLIETPAVNNVCVKGYYGIAYNYQTPVSQIEPMNFANDAENRGSSTQDFEMNLKIAKGATTEYDNTEANPATTAGQYVEFFHTNPYTCSGTTGLYTGTYTLTPSANDVSTTDNTRSFQFRIHANTFTKDNGVINGSVRLGSGDPFRIGNHYFIVNGSSNGLPITATRAQVAVANNSTVNGTELIAYLYKWEDLNADMDITDDELTEVGNGSKTLSGSNNSIQNIDLLESNPPFGPIVLEDNTNYILVVDSDGDQAIATSDAIDYLAVWGETNRLNNPRFATVVSSGGTWFSQGFGTETVAIARLVLNVPTGVEQLTDKQISLNVSPNPVSDVLTAQVNFDAPQTEVTYSVIDATGKVINTTTHSNVSVENYTYNVSHLATGNYYFNVRTSEGFRTIEFSVVR